MSFIFSLGILNCYCPAASSHSKLFWEINVFTLIMEMGERHFAPDALSALLRNAECLGGGCTNPM